MVPSRLRKYQEQQDKKRIVWALAGSLGVLLFLLLFGVRILVGFSLMVDRLRGNTPATSQQQTVLLPPTLDPLPVATNSAALTLTGKGQEGLMVIVYVNESEYRRVPVETGGAFELQGLPFQEGTNTVSAKQTDKKGKLSDLSDVLTITYKKTPPKLTLSAPDDNATITGETRIATVTGATDPDVSVTINDRLVVVRSDGSFSYDYPLNDGDNILKIVASDEAGNTTTLERKVKYEK